MTAYSRLQEKEFLREQQVGYEAVKHQRFVGTGYFDAVQQVITGGITSTMALEGSTEQAQFSDVIDLLAVPGNGHGITNPMAMGDALFGNQSFTDPSLLAPCWEACDELMPSGD